MLRMVSFSGVTPPLVQFGAVEVKFLNSTSYDDFVKQGGKNKISKQDVPTFSKVLESPTEKTVIFAINGFDPQYTNGGVTNPNAPLQHQTFSRPTRNLLSDNQTLATKISATLKKMELEAFVSII